MPTAGPRIWGSRDRSVGSDERREALWDGAHDLDPLLLQAECRRERGCAEDREQRPGQARGEPGPDEQRDDDSETDGDRRAIGRIDMLQGGDDLRDRLGPVDLHPKELAELAGHHDHGDASEVADEHGTTEELRDESHAQQARGQGQHAHDQGTHARHGGIRGGVTDGQGGEGSRGEDRGRGLGTDAEEPRCARNHVDRERRQARPEANDGVQPGQGRIGHDLRNQVGRNAQAGEGIRPDAGAIELLQAQQVVLRGTCCRGHGHSVLPRTGRMRLYAGRHARIPRSGWGC